MKLGVVFVAATLVCLAPTARAFADVAETQDVAVYDATVKPFGFPPEVIREYHSIIQRGSEALPTQTVLDMTKKSESELLRHPDLIIPLKERIARLQAILSFDTWLYLHRKSPDDMLDLYGKLSDIWRNTMVSVMGSSYKSFLTPDYAKLVDAALRYTAAMKQSDDKHDGTNLTSFSRMRVAAELAEAVPGEPVKTVLMEALNNVVADPVLRQQLMDSVMNMKERGREIVRRYFRVYVFNGLDVKKCVSYFGKYDPLISGSLMDEKRRALQEALKLMPDHNAQ